MFGWCRIDVALSTFMSLITSMWVRVVSAGISLLALVGCEATTDTSLEGRGWGEDFEAARQAESGADFAQGVLMDDVVTDAEMQEANERLVRCLEDGGFPGTVVDGGGGLTIPLPPGQAEAHLQAVNEACEDSLGWPSISILYRSTRINPENVDWDELLAACLVRHEVVPSGYRGEDHRDDIERFLSGHTTGTDGSPIDGISFNDAERGPDVYRQCQERPLG